MVPANFRKTKAPDRPPKEKPVHLRKARFSETSLGPPIPLRGGGGRADGRQKPVDMDGGEEACPRPSGMNTRWPAMTDNDRRTDAGGQGMVPAASLTDPLAHAAPRSPSAAAPLYQGPCQAPEQRRPSAGAAPPPPDLAAGAPPAAQRAPPRPLLLGLRPPAPAPGGRGQAAPRQRPGPRRHDQQPLRAFAPPRAGLSRVAPGARCRAMGIVAAVVRRCGRLGPGPGLRSLPPAVAPLVSQPRVQPPPPPPARAQQTPEKVS